MALEGFEAKSVLSRLRRVVDRPLFEFGRQKDKVRGIDAYKTEDDLCLAFENATMQFEAAHCCLPEFDDPRSFNSFLFLSKFLAAIEMPPISDKLVGRSHAARRVGPEILNRVRWIGKDVRQLLAAQPEAGRYVLKASHGSGWNLPIDLPFTGDVATLRVLTEGWMTSQFGFMHGEWFYSMAEPFLFLEDLIEFEEGRCPRDYKIWCFHGKAQLLQVHVDRHQAHRMAHYDRTWHEFPFSIMKPRISSPRPANLEKLIAVAERISSGYSFLRVDLYADDTLVRFGEATFIPGNACLPFSDTAWEAVFGRAWFDPTYMVGSDALTSSTPASS